MLYESIALPLSYVGVATAQYSNRGELGSGGLGGQLQAERGGLTGRIGQARAADAVW